MKTTAAQERKMPIGELYNLLSDNVKQDVDKKLRGIKKLFFIWVIFLHITGGLIALIAFTTPSGQQPDLWFQRSGSLLSIVALVAEILFVKKLQKLVISLHWADLSPDIYVERKFKPLLDSSIFTTILLVIVGTLVWGYGDIFYNWFCGAILLQ